MSTTAPIKERPIPMSAPMVLATLAYLKTQTRRIIKSQPYTRREEGFGWPTPKGGFVEVGGSIMLSMCPYGNIGDRLWLREDYALAKAYDKNKASELTCAPFQDVWYLADGPKPEWAGRTRSYRFMPRRASRCLVEITELRAERVMDISEADAIAEGAKRFIPVPGDGDAETYRQAFIRLWNFINAKRGHPFSANDFVWVVGYRRVK